MRYRTDLMRSILTSKTAQKMIDYVSPIYGNSYVGLWIFQTIGSVLDYDCQLADALRYETNPATATLLLDQWEDHYRIERGVGLTVEQRRARLVSKIQSKGACNPDRLAAAVSEALGGVTVEIQENVAKNTFQVVVLEDVESLDPAIPVIERMKPAHLIYTIRIEIRTIPTATVKVAGAMTYSETYSLHEIAYEDDADLIYVEDETLVANAAGMKAEGETLVIADGIASIEEESLIIQ